MHENPGMEHLQRHDLFNGALVAVRDVCCTAHVSPCGAEEWSGTQDVVFTRRGAYLKQVGKERVVADASQVLFYQPNQPYRVGHPVAGGDETTAFTFAPSVLREALRPHLPAAADRPELSFGMTHSPVSSAALLRHHLLRQRLRQGGGTEPLAAEEEALALLRQVLHDAFAGRGPKPVAARAATARAHREQTEGAKTVLLARLGDALTLADVAQAVHCSPYHLARLFRRQAGLPLHQYLLRLRLAAALERLADGGQDLTRLALSLGFASHSHFSTAFRHQFGLAPSAFRQHASAVRQVSKILKA
jgi:AraC family transcriptional regulator